MSDTFIDYELLGSFPVDGFKEREPFPWSNLHGFLTPGGFRALCEEFPPLELFEYHNNIQRAYGQRSHNRHYLAYESSIYHKEDAGGGGIVRHDRLPAAWQRFMDELETSERYHDFVRQTLDTDAFNTRYAWHVGSNGSEVSPHVDAPEKLGTHIIYFNTSDEWNPAWGGATLVLGGKRTDAMNPDFADFTTRDEARIVDNHSFLFKNTPASWHGASALTCPPGSYRRLFNVIFETPNASAERNPRLSAPTAGRRLLDRARTFLRR
ncbi:MAG: 2OG-Fe(II) oxygenase [Rubrivivax sp.]|nr:2OG-Fe(II) oxygenase [Pyrinomonadaceae bacterium]